MDTEKYLKRRTIKAGETTEVIINDIIYLDDSTIGILIDAAEDYFLMECPIDNNLEIYKNFNFLSNLDSIENTPIDIIFNSKMNKCGFEEDNYNISLQHIENTANLSTDNKSKNDAINQLKIFHEYVNTDNDKSGLQSYITSVSNISETKINVKVSTDIGSILQFSLEIPLTTETEE
jgi:uncharacterized protein Smg (DUF494 family)